MPLPVEITRLDPDLPLPAYARPGDAGLDLYARSATETADRLRHILDNRVHDPMVWAGMKAVYAVLVATRPDTELAETFFNSVTRKIFTTVGVDPRIEFVDSDVVAPAAPTPVVRT